MLGFTVSLGVAADRVRGRASSGGSRQAADPGRVRPARAGVAARRSAGRRAPTRRSGSPLIILRLLFGQPEEQEIVTDLKAEDSLAVLIGFAAMICVVAPLAEEFFFRGFLFRVLCERDQRRRWRPSSAARCSGWCICRAREWIGVVVLSGARLPLCVLVLVRTVVVDPVHHVACVPQFDLVRRREGAALVGIPAAHRRKRHDDARHRPACHAAPRRAALARAGAVAVASAALLRRRCLGAGPTPTPAPMPTRPRRRRSRAR